MLTTNTLQVILYILTCRQDHYKQSRISDWDILNIIRLVWGVHGQWEGCAYGSRQDALEVCESVQSSDTKGNRVPANGLLESVHTRSRVGTHAGGVSTSRAVSYNIRKFCDSLPMHEVDTPHSLKTVSNEYPFVPITWTLENKNFSGISLS